MRLKEIEILGFKSFPDRTSISFKEGITGIVGPNGCGKSNISDAVRWVLGEQSVKTLRGSKMEDVIFTGTSSRKPLGYCEVTIVFDNEDGKIALDYREVAITRRVFRSGESEYYINKNSCRLKDIREILMDTGVGKEGYSVIGQGKIDEILSSRPEDRRNIFEEAAGIVKYKSKKEESERKLKRTEDNLTRINDLVYELNKQEKSLRKQSEKAEEYENSYDTLRSLEINKYLEDLEASQEDLLRSQEALEEITESLALKNTSREEKALKLEEAQESLKLLKDKIEASKEEVFANETDLAAERNKLSIYEETEKFNSKDLERIKAENQELAGKILDLEQANLSIEEELKLKQEELEELILKEAEEGQSIREKSDHILALEQEVEASKNLVMDIYNKISDKRSRLNSVVSFNENIGIRNKQIYNRISALEEELAENSLLVEELSSRQASYEKELATRTAEKEAARTRLEDLTRDLEDLTARINKNRVDLESNLSNYRVYKNMEDSYEGYYKGVKSALRASESNKDIDRAIIDVVAGIIDVPKEYELAISTALGGSSQNIVTRDQASAKLVIDYLRKNNLGRATFLPLDTIKPRSLSLDQEKRSKYHVCGLGSEIIDYDPSYRNVIEYLLGRTVIVENMDYAIGLSNSHGNSLRIVTLDGGIINPGGSMTGGSLARENTNLISRKNKLLEIENNIEGFRLEAGLYKEDYSKLDQDLGSLRQLVLDLENTIKSLDYNIFQVKSQRSTAEKEAKRLGEELLRNRSEIDTLDQEADFYRKEELDIKEELAGLEKELEAIRARIKELEASLNKELGLRDTRQEELTEQKIIINKLRTILATKRASREDNLRLVDEHKAKIRDNEKKEEALKEELLDLDQSKKESMDLIKGYGLRQREIKEELEALEKALKDDLEAHTGLEELFSMNSREIEALKDRKLKKELEIEKIGLRLRSLDESIRSKYELKEEELAYNKELDSSEDKIVAYRKKIRQLGNVNLNAIEEYAELRDRLDFINKQRQDLKDAKKDLLKVIKSIEETMKDLFLTSFEEIDRNFQLIFKTLFNGGEARLALEDRSDVLNTGIEIIARPPGKKSQNLASLSGGERSLVAVAILFAILEMKPSPFCILDEIDAALDEANIGRYTAYLENISEKTQFIIITHRKTTMEIADTLYGITMEEEGVSKVVSVELKEYNKVG